MRYFAILKDSFRETLDCKSMWVLGIASTLIILVCWSVSFTLLTPDQALGNIANGFNRVSRIGPGTLVQRTFGAVSFEVRDSRALEDGEYEARLRVSPAKEFHALVRFWEGVVRGKIRKNEDPVPEGDVAANVELQKKFFIFRLREQQLTQVSVEPEEASGDVLSYRLRFKPARADLIKGAHKMGLLFGLYSRQLPGVSAAEVVTGAESVLANAIAGWVGIIFAVVVTASFVPDMLLKGRIDIVLAKPIARATLLVYKYLGGLLYVLLNAVYLVGGCWLGLSVRSGHWDPAFLWSIPVLTLAFATLYAFSAWLGVVTRSFVMAMLGTLGLWLTGFGVWAVRKFLAGLSFTGTEAPGWAQKGVDFVYYVLPKTSDLGAINDYLILRGNMGDEATAPLRESGIVELNWLMLVGTSFAFLAFFLGLACVSFSKRDY